MACEPPTEAEDQLEEAPDVVAAVDADDAVEPASEAEAGRNYTTLERPLGSPEPWGLRRRHFPEAAFHPKNLLLRSQAA